MTSDSGRYVITYHGEVYNFLDLRRELAEREIAFRGRSDTEVMLAAIECRGLVAAVRQFTGMFAFALFDRHERTLSLVRDRVGEKPLYYAWMGRTLLFGSELKALRAHPAWVGEIDRGALALLLRHNYVPGPYSIYRAVRKVRPGSILVFREPGCEPEEIVYWSARHLAESRSALLASAGGEDLVSELDALLRRVVRREMVSDVPLGAFLSGGIDSSLVVALMEAESDRPVRTFTVGFREEAYSEAEHARAVVAARQARQATVRFETPPGRQAQVDFGQRRAWIGEHYVAAHLFVCTLGSSRHLFATAFPHERRDTVLAGHEQGCAHCGGVPLQIRVDNAKPVVLERTRVGTVWHPVYADFAAYYGFTPWAHWPYRPQTQGKVESNIGYVTRNALAGNRFGSWSHLNAWLLEVRPVAPVFRERVPLVQIIFPGSGSKAHEPCSALGRSS